MLVTEDLYDKTNNLSNIPKYLAPKYRNKNVDIKVSAHDAFLE